MKKTIKVAVQEEYGFRWWLWDTGFTEAKDLISFWETIDTVEDIYFFDPSRLPGSLREVGGWYDLKLIENIWTCHLHMDDDSALCSPEGVTYRHAGWNLKNIGEYF